MFKTPYKGNMRYLIAVNGIKRTKPSCARSTT